MVDISQKEIIKRYAKATGRIRLSPTTLKKITEGKVEKGNVLSTARTAAIFAVKRTPDLIPMCHQIPITAVDVEFDVREGYVNATVKVSSVGKTGVEMEAVTGVSVALLTIWDMVKSAEKDETGNYPSTYMEEIRVIEKTKKAIE